jgi:hypothetical protein
MENIFGIISIVVIILLLCFAAMAIRIWTKKDGHFVEIEIGRNTNMQKLGIKCIKQEEMEQNNKNKNKQLDCNICDGCFLKKEVKSFDLQSERL